MCIIVCSILADVACAGQDSVEFTIGSTVEEILGNLSAQFCGCTHVYGNIRISMEGLSTDRILNETDFSLFYHLEQISGAFFLEGIVETTRIILPNLRIIRGQELELGNYSVVLRNVSVHEIILPKLTEVSQGSVLIEQPFNYPICNWAQVEWLDIIDNGGIVHSFQDCGPERKPLIIRYKIVHYLCLLQS